MDISGEERTPKPVATALIFNSRGELLLLRSGQWRDKYIIPGGKIRYGETIEDAVRREVREETGLEIREIEFLFLAEAIESPEALKKKHSIYLIHRCRAVSDTVLLNHEAQSYRWVPLDEALALDLNSTSRGTLSRLMSGG